MITLRAVENYNPRFAPAGAKKAYIARITGRDSKMTFSREFLGKESADVDTAGLYETRDVDKKGRAQDSEYCVILEEGDDLIQNWIEKELAMKIAKALDDGRRIESVVEIVGDEARLVTPRQAEAKAVAQSIDTAVDACWQALMGLSEKEAKKVLAALKVRVTPPRKTDLAETAPVGMVSDKLQEDGVSPAELGITPTPVAE